MDNYDIILLKTSKYIPLGVGKYCFRPLTNTPNYFTLSEIVTSIEYSFKEIFMSKDYRKNKRAIKWSAGLSSNQY